MSVADNTRPYVLGFTVGFGPLVLAAQRGFSHSESKANQLPTVHGTSIPTTSLGITALCIFVCIYTDFNFSFG
jgi:hypothetical protein